MGTTLHVTAYGRPAAELLAAGIRDIKKDDPLRRVTVVVPTNSVGVAIRRALGRGDLKATDHGTGVVGMTFLTVYRLAELLGAPRLAAQDRRPASTPVIAAAFRRELAADPGVFSNVADHPSTEESLIRAHRELSNCSDPALDTLGATGPRAHDVVDLHRRVRARLAPDWYEEVDLLAAAVDTIRAGSPILDDLGAVLVYLPQDTTAPAAELLTVLADVTEVGVIAAATGVPTADADLTRTLRRLGLDPALPEVPAMVADTIISVSDPEDEAREAVNQIMSAARAGIPFERMAILYPQDQPYARLVDDMLSAADIPANGRAVRPLSEHLAGRWLLDVLDLPSAQYARPAVMSVLAEAPVRLADGRRPAVTSWERISRDAGIVRTAAQWRDRLSAWADAQHSRADLERAAAEPRDWLIEQLLAKADDAAAMQVFVADLIERVEQGRRLSEWTSLADWARALLHDHLGDEGGRQRWPEHEQNAAGMVEAAIDRLAGLDTVEPATNLAIFRRTLQLELDADLGRRGTLGTGVLTGPTSMALGVDLDLVVVLGLAEGSFPPRVREDSLLADRERRAIEDELDLRAERTHVMHRQLLAALASSERRVLVWPRGDMRRSAERHPSRWLLDACEARSGIRELGPSGTTVPSFAARMATSAFPLTAQDHALRGLAGDPTALDALMASDPRFGRSSELSQARRQHDVFSRFDGNLADVADALPQVTVPGGTRLSASSLQLYATCPHAWFAQKLLRVDELKDPEDRFEIDVLDRGSLIHEVLEQWLDERILEGAPAPDQSWSDGARRRLFELARRAFTNYEARGLTGHPTIWAYDQRAILGDLERFLVEDDEFRRRTRQTPESVEYEFGPVEVPLGNGDHIVVGGKIDRVDRREDGGLGLIDYKTGKSDRTKKLSPEDPDLGGRHLQLLLYTDALRIERGQPELPVHAGYWYVTARGRFDWAGYEVTADMVTHLHGTLAEIVGGMRAGRFPQVPKEMNRWVKWVDCAYCEPDSLGTADAYRRWEQLRELPDLRSFIRLIDRDLAARLDPQPDDLEVGDG